jgi:hypothetical protein
MTGVGHLHDENLCSAGRLSVYLVNDGQAGESVGDQHCVVLGGDHPLHRGGFGQRGAHQADHPAVAHPRRCDRHHRSEGTLAAQIPRPPGRETTPADRRRAGLQHLDRAGVGWVAADLHGDRANRADRAGAYLEKLGARPAYCAGDQGRCGSHALR